MSRVHRLDDSLVDQIAAGEVVERPASVVKELVENALDAEASRIRVEIRGGGADLVAVSDDGLGMSPEDARLALERHATSKLQDLADLEQISSFGFRGEALPAIASVSRLRLTTRARGASEAIEIRVEHGRLREAHPAGGPEGTRLEVADLFAAVPARRRFLKSAATEWGHISDWLARAALALPGVHFDVRRDERTALSWPSVVDPLERIAAVLSEDDAAALVAAEGEGGGMWLQVYTSRPDHHRATARGIHLFVNRRPVRDRMLRHALLQVYRDVLPRGRFPTALLFLQTPPGAVDVNVHPAKWEVRFSDPQGVHRLVTATLGRALAGRGWLGEASPPRTRDRVAWPDRVGEGRRVPRADSAGEGDWTFARSRSPSLLATIGDEAPSADAERPFRFSDLRLLGQLLGTYLLVEDKQGLLLVDQHAAHERVLYERLRAGWLEGGVERQGMLLPVTVGLPPAALVALEEHAELVQRLGFEAEGFGEGVAILRAVPALLAERDPAGLLRGLAEELQDARDWAAVVRAGTRVLDGADQLFASLACHSARRAGDVLEEPEQRSLLDALDAIPWAPTCPHGRPVAVPVPLGEIERRFGRS